MPTRDLDAVFFVGCVPEISFDDGMFHVGYAVGRRARFEIVMRPSTFNQAMLLAEEARAKWQLAALGANVSPIRKKA